jgi:hypothetical protein
MIEFRFSLQARANAFLPARRPIYTSSGIPRRSPSSAWLRATKRFAFCPVNVCRLFERRSRYRADPLAEQITTPSGSSPWLATRSYTHLG